MSYLFASVVVVVQAVFGGCLLFGSKRMLRELARRLPSIAMPSRPAADSKQEKYLFLFWRFIGGSALTVLAMCLYFLFFRRNPT